MVVGGMFGSLVGAAIFRALQASGQIDVVIGFLYVVLLGYIGFLMLKDALDRAWAIGRSRRREARRATIAGSPRFRFAGASTSRACTSRPLAPLALGFGAGMLTMLLGIGGGFILVPAMIYILGMPARVVIGTSLGDHPGASAAGTTMVHALTTRSVDIVLAFLLLIGGVIGAQYGAVLATRMKPDFLRLALAIVILLVGGRMLLGLTWRPDDIFTVEYL